MISSGRFQELPWWWLPSPLSPSLSSLSAVVAASLRLHLAPRSDQHTCTGAALSALVKGICLLLTVGFSPC